MVHWRDTPCGLSALRWCRTAWRKGSLAGNLESLGGDAIDNVSDGSAVRVDGVVVLLW